MNTEHVNNFQELSIVHKQWIAVKDQLPQYNVEVLVFLSILNTMIICKRTSTDERGEHWSCEHEKYVSFWMELPLPPLRKE
jgi:hypothetical protein